MHHELQHGECQNRYNWWHRSNEALRSLQSSESVDLLSQIDAQTNISKCQMSACVQLLTQNDFMATQQWRPRRPTWCRHTSICGRHAMLVELEVQRRPGVLLCKGWHSENACVWTPKSQQFNRVFYQITLGHQQVWAANEATNDLWNGYGDSDSASSSTFCFEGECSFEPTIV